jgi:hypothetical protein
MWYKFVEFMLKEKLIRAEVVLGGGPLQTFFTLFLYIKLVHYGCGLADFSEVRRV